MKEKILFCGYRSWALQIFHELSNRGDLVLAQNTEELYEKLEEHEFTTLLFIGWSWIIREDIINTYKCICLHPSPLPKYRGGSPIQHQVINGEKTSAVTLFKMDSGIDTGPVLFQKEYSLEGTLEDIFDRIVEAGTKGVQKIIEGDYNSTRQNEQESTTYKRRTKDMSEITLEDFRTNTAKEIFNKVRCLQAPYPLPFVTCKNNTKLYLKEVIVTHD